MLKTIFRLVTIFMVLKMYVACSKVQFSQVPSPDPVPAVTCEQRSDCKVEKTRAKISGSFQVRGQVDILFVVDNSGSMSFEHGRMDTSFPDLFNKISHLDYRIAMVTTDISDANNPPRAINGHGALQDGNLIRFSNGQYFLDSTTANAETLFADAIQRSETLQCETFLEDPNTKTLDSHARQQGYLDNCPSSDERGIYAANLVVSNNPENFLRDFGHLAVVLISDEDVRSNSSVRDISRYNMVALDMPETLQTVFETKFPSINTGLNSPIEQKSLAFHSIVVEPGDNSCLAIQNAQTEGVKGAPGEIYVQASDLTGGVVGDVCAADYTQQMGDIGNNIATNVASFTLDCAAEDLVIDYTPAVSGVEVVQSGKTVSFTGPLIMNSSVTFSYSCPLF